MEENDGVQSLTVSARRPRTALDTSPGQAGVNLHPGLRGSSLAGLRTAIDARFPFPSASCTHPHQCTTPQPGHKPPKTPSPALRVSQAAPPRPPRRRLGPGRPHHAQVRVPPPDRQQAFSPGRGTVYPHRMLPSGVPVQTGEDELGADEAPAVERKRNRHNTRGSTMVAISSGRS